MRQYWRPALVTFIALTVIVGAGYPLLVTGIARVAFPEQAQGSLIHDGSRIVGSSLIGQPFRDARYFWARPSATIPVPYNAEASAGSNLGPANPSLAGGVGARARALKALDPDNPSPIPIDLVTCSASGLDPHISLAAAEYQAARVARARALPESSVRELLRANTQGRTLGFMGEPVVNVVAVNLALDRLEGRR